MTLSQEEITTFGNTVGVEALRLIEDRVKQLRPMAFDDVFSLMMKSAEVAFASILGQVIENVERERRGQAADDLVALGMRQVRELLEQVVQEPA